MRETSRWRRAAAALSVLALAAAACGNGDEDAPDDAPAAAEEPADTDEAPDEEPGEAPAEIATDFGVTEEPCPDAVNPDNGCIYLGILSDLTQGPFAPVGVTITEGQEAFWQRVNDEGGIGGFDINVTEFTRDTLYDPMEHSTLYRQIEPSILALAQTLGTPTTEAILADMDADDVLGVPASWWSGWHFEETDKGVILESGYSYCIESMIGLDWHTAERGEISTLIHVGYPGDYGGDSAAGAEAWAEANGVEFAGAVTTLPAGAIENQDEAVGAILNSGADVAVIATGPVEMAEIVGKVAAAEGNVQFLGSVPTWNPALNDSPAAPALQAFYTLIGPWEDFSGESAAHQAMQEALGGELPVNDGFTFGWIWSYPMKAALEAAAANGDLTRAGLRAVIDGLEVDYEGALPTTTFGGDPNENAIRTGVISVPDPDGPLGVRTLETGVTGPTADAFEYTEPCIAF